MTVGSKPNLLVIVDGLGVLKILQQLEKTLVASPQILNDYLKTPERAISYLKSAFEENDPELFQAALEDVTAVHEKPLLSLPTLPKLVESLQRHGVSEDIITSVVADMRDAD